MNSLNNFIFLVFNPRQGISILYSEALPEKLVQATVCVNEYQLSTDFEREILTYLSKMNHPESTKFMRNRLL